MIKLCFNKVPVTIINSKSSLQIQKNKLVFAKRELRETFKFWLKMFWSFQCYQFSISTLFPNQSFIDWTNNKLTHSFFPRRMTWCFALLVNRFAILIMPSLSKYETIPKNCVSCKQTVHWSPISHSTQQLLRISLKISSNNRYR